MIVRRHGLLVVALCLACALLAACGRDDSSKTSSEPEAPAKARKSGPVAFTAPTDGKRVRARETKGGAWITRVQLRGTAPPNSTVFIRAGCKPDPCESQTTAGDDGTWTESMKVRTKPSVRFVPIDAGPDARLASGSAVVTVELFGPRTVEATSGPSKPKENRATKEPARALPREVLLIGDSLAVGIKAPLKAELRGWKVKVDALESRPLAAGLRILQRQSEPPAILAFTLFTNDDPRNVKALEAAVRASATRSGGCAVWGTIVRPPYQGTSYAGVNQRLKQLARQEQLALGLQIADWAGAVASEPSLLAGDGVHATPAGYATMARLYADAIRACAGEEL